ncbi:MAG TPA: copper transporter [Phycicoccus sp.]
MIDFRYHLVSIVSIFLALAVGIVLGAGPLQGEIGDTLGKEVAGLRADKARLNNELASAQAGIDGRDGYIEATNPRILPGALAGRTVAIVELPAADAAVTESTVKSLGTAGARVVSTTTLTENWVSTNEATASVRDAVVQRVAASTGVAVDNSGAVAPRDILLATLLGRPSDANATTIDPEVARTGLAALGDGGLLSLDTSPGAFERAELVVVVSGAVTAGNADAQTAAADRWVDLVVALDDRSQGAVLAAAVDAEGDGVSVLATLRNDATAVKAVSSVDDSDGPMGQASVVHALAEQAGGRTGQYGFAPGADAPFAPLPAS